MADNDNNESREKLEVQDRVNQTDRIEHTPQHMKNEAVSDSRRAKAYEHKFDTFSDNDDDQSFQTMKPGETLEQYQARLAERKEKEQDSGKPKIDSFGLDFGDGTVLTSKGFVQKNSEPNSDIPLTAEPTPGNHYTVKPGDALWKIARMAIGSNNSNQEIKHFAERIAELNKIANPDLIRIGQILRLPSTSDAAQSDQDSSSEPETGSEHVNISEIAEHSLDRSERNSDVLESSPESVPESIESTTEKEKSDLGESKEEILEDIGRISGRKQILELAKKHDFDGELIEKTVKSIEERAARKEITPEEIKRTYKEVERLLETPSKAGVSDQHREILAQQILEQTAAPNSIDQGQFNTCNVCTVECRSYSRKPSEAAKLVTDIALNGEYSCNIEQLDGTIKAVTVQLAPIPFYEPTLDIPVKDGIRSYASQIFQVAAINVHYKAEGKGTWYEQKKFDKDNPHDNGEVLHRHDGTTIKNPDLPDYSFVDIYNAIAKSSDTSFLLEAPGNISGPDRNITHITSQTDLEQKLLEAEQKNNFPLIIGVDCANEPFWSDGGFGSAGGSGDNLGGGHVVTITGINHGPPMRIKIDNQWGKQADHLHTAKELPLRDVYLSMLDPITASDELSKIIKREREQGNRSAWHELDYERLRIISNKKIEAINKSLEKSLPTVPYREIEMDVINSITSRFDPKVKQPDELERAGLLDKLAQVMPELPRDCQIRIQREEAKLGLISHAQYKQALTEYGKFTTGPEATDQQCKEFNSLLAELPESERAKILAQL